MKSIARMALGVAVLILVGSAGCANLPLEQAYWQRIGNRALYQTSSSTQTAADRMHTHRQVVDQDARALIDDIDYVLLRDRPSRLSRWHNR